MVSLTFSASALSRRAYSLAASTSWIEQGPITMNRRGSFRSRMLRTVSRPLVTVSRAVSLMGNLRLSSAGGISSSWETTLMSSTCVSVMNRSKKEKFLHSASILLNLRDKVGVVLIRLAYQANSHLGSWDHPELDAVAVCFPVMGNTTRPQSGFLPAPGMRRNTV